LQHLKSGNLIDKTKIKSFAVLGAGKSGVAVARLLHSKGYNVLLSEYSAKENFKDTEKSLFNTLPFKCEFGGHSEMVYNCDVIVKSPGIEMDNSVILKAIDRGIYVTGEIEVASWFCDVPVVAVTGTNGKTTTTALTGSIFSNAGYDAIVCGNIGFPFADALETLTAKSVIVLEVSSFQLVNTETFHPKVALFLNFTPDHIEWHKTMDNYFDAKMMINKNQRENDMFIINFDDSEIKSKINFYNGVVAGFSVNEIPENSILKYSAFLENGFIYYSDKQKGIKEKIIKASDIFIRGRHNISNSLAAILAAKSFDIGTDVIENTLKQFKGVEHRIEFVREYKGVKYYNDSKATNIDSMTVAVESFDKNIILILGGKKMDVNFQPVLNLIKQRVKYIVAVGASKNEVNDFFKNHIEVKVSDSFEDAVRLSYEGAVKGDIVLFSPSYKSFDMFENYEQRGKVFKNLVNNLEKYYEI